MNKKLKTIAGIAVLVLTIGLFVWYFHAHPSLITQLQEIPLSTFLILLTLTFCVSGSLMLILHFSLRLCKTSIAPKENALLTIYSSIVNFFGPLQSGPGFRAVYLKRRHKVNFKDFVRFSLLYYAFFAFFSAVFLFGPVLAWWQALAVFALVIGILLAALRYKHVSLRSLSQEYLLKLGLATLLQVSIVALIYFIELRAVDTHVSVRQAIIYTGAANFALFVSLTPGAIGFRESFLLLANRLHHIPNDVVITASVIDRAVYLVFLGLLFLLALSLHAKEKLKRSTS
ncbi:MAG TPA: lysylphosphatidylglycerol synthase domain-containing protein [Patescibacteria group bacterium]|nr:lysylphosphatidylglycerol synthase domain-containing protein [Patescibacteria group bacterium]